MRVLIKNILFFLRNRFVLFVLFLSILFISFYFYSGTFLPNTGITNLWFYSGLFMLGFSILFIEPYYTSPKNIITNVIPLLLVFLSIKTTLDNQVVWWSAVVVFLSLLLGSIISMALNDKNKSPENKQNYISKKIKDVVVFFGNGRLLYSAVFFYFLLTYYSIQNKFTLLLFVYWFFIVSVDTRYIHSNFVKKTIKKDKNKIGEIFGVQSKKIFLVKLFDDRCSSISKFDLVKFRYSMMDSEVLAITGIVFDTYLLNQEKWAKILQMDYEEKEDEKMDKNIVYKISDAQTISHVSKEIRVTDFVGVVIEGSTIGKIKFEYSKQTDNLQEGDLLELKVGNRQLFYQVIAGTTEKEKLEARNETGYINGDAIQLGEWCGKTFSFQKFGWVPSINTPIFKADTKDLEVSELKYPDYCLGKIPGTKLPSAINLNDAISHHMALLGVTGSGKSFLAREIINEIKKDTKVICVDFNQEFSSTMTPVPNNIIDTTNAEQITGRIDLVNTELEKFPNQQDKKMIALRQKETKHLMKLEIDKFLDNKTEFINIFELPDVSNTTGILDYTKCFFKVLFEVAKERQLAGKSVKICVVLEEAHTVIPEWNFSGSSDKVSQSLVNSIGQIALQGRKYGVGFMVIAQRTANVSKTVLTQCNTVICFQAFDETSFNFIGNYVGNEMVQVLPNLKQFHALVTGKAIRSNIPMIIDLEREKKKKR